MQAVRYTWVDVFSMKPFSGNRLCVFSVSSTFPVRNMHEITQELNHSETTFLQPATTAGADHRLRIMMPESPQATEIPFAGHPILGSACVAAAARSEGATVRFETGVGIIAVEVTPIAPREWAARMEQPFPQSAPLHIERADVAAALGLSLEELHESLPMEVAHNGLRTALVPLTSVTAVEKVQVDYARLRAVFGTAGTMIFALGGVAPGTNVHCRLFMPELGAEDPATGSANGPLGEYLVRHGLVTGGIIRSEQGFEMGRPSLLSIQVETHKVFVSGHVHLLGGGEFIL